MYKIGDRVSRIIMIGETPRYYGNIVEIYKTKNSGYHAPIKLFAIKWDNIEEIQRGYLEQSLQIEKD
jgi:hypothetical protein